MNKSYVINDVAIFFPEKRTIMSSVSGNRIRLNAPTAQLLKAFIHNEGNTISQNDLYSIVWGDNGISVTPNTLYQNISLLRKALKDSGVVGEPLTTIRGQGFLFTVSTLIEKGLDDDSNAEVTVSAPRINYKILLSFITVIVLIFSGLILFMKKSDIVGNYVKEYTSLTFNNSCGIYDEGSNEGLERN